jgi:hypothetical protein
MKRRDFMALPKQEEYKRIIFIHCLKVKGLSLLKV